MHSCGVRVCVSMFSVIGSNFQAHPFLILCVCVCAFFFCSITNAFAPNVSFFIEYGFVFQCVFFLFVSFYLLILSLSSTLYLPLSISHSLSSSLYLPLSISLSVCLPHPLHIVFDKTELCLTLSGIN